MMINEINNKEEMMSFFNRLLEEANMQFNDMREKELFLNLILNNKYKPRNEAARKIKCKLCKAHDDDSCSFGEKLICISENMHDHLENLKIDNAQIDRFTNRELELLIKLGIMSYQERSDELLMEELRKFNSDEENQELMDLLSHKDDGFIRINGDVYQYHKVRYL